MLRLSAFRVLLAAATVVLLVAAGACSSDDGGEDEATTYQLDDAEAAVFEVRPNTEAITVVGAEPGATLAVVDEGGTVQSALFSPDGHQAEEGTVDDEGNLIFSRIEPGDGYQVVALDGDEAVAASEPVRVGDVYDHPEPSLYEDQELVEGLNYIETRDGTMLSALVHFPAAPLPGMPDGQYPTVINYSGYDTSNPAGSASSIAQFLEPYGYATVQVNVRGTGCSGGTFSFFEPDQVADGYDVVEAVAAQDWVLNGQPGLIGISYAGNSQLFTAATQPPNLAAIAPMSVLDSVYDAVLYPGGIYNNGFAAQWASNVADGAEPLGQGWEQGVIDEGGPIGEQCAENQEVRSQNPDLNALAAAYPFYDPELADPLTATTFADRIEVPIFMTGSWQDEQTGGHAPALIETFTGSPDVHIALTNGTHGDALIPEHLQRWFEFLDFYVAQRVPEVPPLIRAAAAGPLADQFGPGEYELPPDRFTGQGYDEALAEYQAEPDVRVLFENGAGSDTPANPTPTFVEEHEAWPPPDAEPTSWYLQPGGELGEDPAEVDADDDAAHTDYAYDATAGQEVSIATEGFSFSGAQEFAWQQVEEGEAASYLSTPLDEDLVMLGPGSADLWISSTAEDTDLEVTLSEVYEDGSEVYVQNGWLRASQRRLDDERSTELRPVQTHQEEDAEPLVPGEPTEVRVEIFPFGHVFHEGSQLRLTVSAPGGDRPLWRFDSLDTGESVTDTVWQSGEHPSRIVLPVLAGDHDVPDGPPPCPGLRGQPCRAYP